MKDLEKGQNEENEENIVNSVIPVIRSKITISQARELGKIGNM